MTPERWNKIKDLFSSAQECPEAERDTFLLEACGGDEDLRREVENLLAASRDDEFMANSAVEAIARVFEGDVTAAMEVSRRPEAGPRLEAGNLINQRYEIIRLLGRGGMGEVYLAADTRINRKIALKVLHTDLVSSKESLRRFAQEAQAVSALNHPHIMTIHEFDTADDGSLFIVAEYIDGQTLNNQIRGGLPLDKAFDIAIQVSSALAAAHEAGITHRDIKPENLMVRRDGYVKVLDFGLAKLTHPDDDVSSSTSSGSEDPTKGLHKTRPGAVMGTAAYMSPEQARGLHVDERTDIWSLGVVIFEMLTGKRPFEGETSADTIVSVLLREPPSVSTFVQNLPPEVDWIVSKALSKNVEARYQTANELRADLEKIKRRVEFDETLERRSGASDRAEDVPAVAAAVPTAPADGTPTDGAKTDGRETHRSQLSFERVVTDVREHKVRFGVVGLLLTVVIAAGLYLGFGTIRSVPIDSIAVLPFENLTGDPELAYLSEGLSESLIDKFAQLPQLKVISRNSSFKFRGKDLDVRDAATKLGVRAVVMGSVDRVGDELVIRVDVIDAVKDQQLAGRQFRRKAGDLNGLQNEIVQLASARFKGDLSDEQTRRLGSPNTENSEAFRYYLSSLVIEDEDKSSRERSIALLERSIALDPNFALAYAELAWIYWTLANAADDPAEVMPKLKASVEKALSLDPNLAQAHVAQAFLYEYDFDWANAEKEYKRAIELSPNYDFARNNYAFFLSVLDRHAEALAQLEEQRVRDPLNERMWLLQKAIVQVQARKFDEALATYRNAHAVDPSKGVPDFALGYAYGGKGMTNEAIEYYRKAVADLGGEEKYSQPLVYLAATYAKQPERRAEARTLLAKIETMNSYRSPALMAVIYSALGDNDKAMELLERSYIKRDLLLRYIRTGYEYDSLRGDPRFAELERRSGLL